MTDTVGLVVRWPVVVVGLIPNTTTNNNNNNMQLLLPLPLHFPLNREE